MVRRFSLGFRSASLLLMAVAALVVTSLVPEVQQAGPAPPASTKQPISTRVSAVSFEPNRGQTDPRVKYISRGTGRALFVKADGLVARLRESESDTDHVVEMKVVGADPVAQATELAPLPKMSSYYIGDDPGQWQRAVPHYGSVRFNNVYPGIDLAYRGSEEPARGQKQDLEYDFIVHPGADPYRIRLAFQGVEEVLLNAQGDLTLRTAVGELRQRRPFIYQKLAEARRSIDGRFDLRPDGQVGFWVGAYDTNLPLVIDPKVEYATYLGGSGEDQAFDIAVGADGRIYATGWTESVNFADVTAKGGSDRDVFLASHISREQVEALPASGRGFLEHTAIFGTPFDDEGQSVRVDGDGNAYVTGWVGPGSSPTTDGSSPGGGIDAFAAIFDQTGDLVHAGRVGGTGDDRGWGIDVKVLNDGSLVVALGGATTSRNGIATGDAFQSGYGGGDSDGFLGALRLDPTIGSPFTVEDQSGSYLGGNGFDVVDSITFGNLSISSGIRRDFDFFAASTTSSTAGMPDSEIVPRIGVGGGTDGHFTALRLDPTAANTFAGAETEVFGAFLPSGPGNEREVQMKHDFGGVLGGPLRSRMYFSFNAGDGIPTDENAPMRNYPGGSQSFVMTMLESDRDTGEPRFSGTTYGGGTEFDQAAKMALDPNNRPGVVGFTFSRLDTTPGAIHRNRRGSFSGFFIRYSEDLSLVDYSTYTWGSQNSNATAIDFDGFGQVHILGIVGPGEQMTPNALQENHQGGSWDAAFQVITQPFVFNNGIGNGASFRPGASPQQISVAVGGLMGPQTPAFLTVDQDGNLLEALGEASVFVDDQPTPMTFGSRNQNNFVYRFDVGFRFEEEKGSGPPIVGVQVGFEGDLSNVVKVPVMEANPGLFALDGSGQGQGAILNPDFTTNGPDNPAPSDGFIIVYGTGGGVTDPLCPDGGFGPFAEPLPRLQLPVQALVGGVEVNQNYAGSAPGLVCGVNQFNVIPTNSPSGPAVPVQVCVNDVCSNVVTAAFE